MVRMRTIIKALEELKIIDPETSVTACRIRRLAKQGKIVSCNEGVLLVDIDSLITYLDNTKYHPKNKQEKETAAEVIAQPNKRTPRNLGKIRRVM